MDAAVMPDLARIGMTALPDYLRKQVERLEETEPELAAVVRADVKRMAGLLASERLRLWMN